MPERSACCPFYNEVERFFRAEQKRFDYPSCAPHANQASHLQVEIDKVRTGSKRLQRVGDIDCWEGSRLAISAEVKQYTIKADSVPDLEGFANETGKRGSLGMVVAIAFEEGVRGEIEALGLKVLDRNDLLRIVELWDPLKQRTAVKSLVYYVRHVEKNSSLTERVEVFLNEAEKAAEKAATPIDAVLIDAVKPTPEAKKKKR